MEKKYPHYVPTPIRAYAESEEFSDLADEADRECLDRLIHASNMKSVYLWLQRAKCDDNQQTGFICAAWSARANYLAWRQKASRAKELAVKIGHTARLLADQLDAFASTQLLPPEALVSVRALLWEALPNGQEASRSPWRVNRKLVLGDVEMNESESYQFTLGEALSSDQRRPQAIPQSDSDTLDTDTTTSMIADVWWYAPSVANCMRTMADVATSYAPRYPFDHIEAATRGRQHHARNEYLLAFFQMLTIDCGFTRSKELECAMATVAEVALSAENEKIDVTPEDVGQLLDYFSRRSPL